MGYDTEKIRSFGAGNGAHTMAAEFAPWGHRSSVRNAPVQGQQHERSRKPRPSDRKGNIKEPQPVRANMVTDDIAEAVEGCRYLVR